MNKKLIKNKALLVAVLTATVSAFTVIAIAEAAEDVQTPVEVKKERKGKLAKFDKDGDKKLSKQEYLDMHAHKFTKMDANADGFITREEMKEARKNARKHFKKHHGDKHEKGFFSKLFGKSSEDCKRKRPEAENSTKGE